MAVVAGVVFLFQPLPVGGMSLPVPTVEVLEADRGPGYTASTIIAAGHYHWPRSHKFQLHLVR